tara:strand:- start:18873 stop:20348 length:1476 start_codon:yes stop_codon:yes gene_type:complete
MRDTEEQKFATDLASKHDSLIVNAAAGAGKSHLLRRIATTQHGRFLYLTFSRMLADEAKRSFPRNAECMTAHGFAFNRLDGRSKLVNKLNRKMTGDLGSELLGIEGRSEDKEQIVAILVSAIEAFSISADERILHHHLPDVDLTPAQKERYIGFSRDLWALMSSRTNNIPITHDMYLKLFQLRKEDLHGQYDCILADEGQDFSPVMLEIIKQSRCRRVVVGDRHQQIYSFRGSVNALDAFPDSSDAVLSQSFRYGEEVAEFANIVLGFKRKPPNFTIRGTSSHKSKAIVGNPLDLPFEDEQHTLIGRTNAALFETAMYITSMMPNLKLNFVSGLQRFLRPIEQCFNLWMGNLEAIHDYPYKRYKSYELFSKSVTFHHPDLEWLCRLFSEFGDDVLGMAKAVEANVVEDPRRAAIVFGTAHSTKGREFNRVVLLEDFRSPIELESSRSEKIAAGEWTDKDEVAHEEEINMLYVAGTRARELLVVPVKIADNL